MEDQLAHAADKVFRSPEVDTEVAGINHIRAPCNRSIGAGLKFNIVARRYARNRETRPASEEHLEVACYDVTRDVGKRLPGSFGTGIRIVGAGLFRSLSGCISGSIPGAARGSPEESQKNQTDYSVKNSADHRYSA